ncbi:hypothetical protein E2558_02805 [Staphylococcus pragensis]|uniref:Uncharacterized protein n=1 Tax=Staphylococcus pragensis TaxID=1611836 RepID=A0A4Z1BRY3_9STAP|nr:hypothetical protein [Staphylococcus pragensis]RTX87283.1 hypothetical protein CD154_09900 [Staphylococcus carnosus]TGN28580.1 hypothetical protein E2558_02805 [Staphylococcus pragensis]GGG86600.1 hypothetical protein GCM10007342_05600 [Staphylococcus pragensis]
MIEEKYVGTKEFEEFKEHVDSRFNHLGDKINRTEATLSEKIDNVELRLDQKIDNVEQKLNLRIDDVEQKLTQRINNVEEKLSHKIDSNHKALTLTIQNMMFQIKEETHKKYIDEIRFIIPTIISIIALVLPIILFILR